MNGSWAAGGWWFDGHSSLELKELHLIGGEATALSGGLLSVDWLILPFKGGRESL